MKRATNKDYDKFREYFSFSCVDLLIFDEKSILLTKRTIKPFKGYWHLPGTIIRRDEKKTLHYIDRVLEINPYDVESLSLKLRVHQFLKEDDVVIDCCRKILEVAPDNFEVRDLISELESKDSSDL